MAKRSMGAYHAKKYHEGYTCNYDFEEGALLPPDVAVERDRERLKKAGQRKRKRVARDLERGEY